MIYNREIAYPDGMDYGPAQGHGTEIAEIVARIAPQSKLVSLDVVDNGFYGSSDGLAGFMWVRANAAAYAITAANYSAGFPGCADQIDWKTVLRDLLMQQNVVPTFSAGNDGNKQQFFPGCDSAADCVSGEACIAAQTGTCVGGPFNGEPCGQASDCQGGSCPLHTVTFPRLNIGAAAATAPTLAADCDHNNVVFVNDVAKIVAILLGNQLLLTCPTADLNGNLNIEINEIVSAANAANTGCPLGATEFTGVY